jgi:hypothetical protein
MRWRIMNRLAGLEHGAGWGDRAADRQRLVGLPLRSIHWARLREFPGAVQNFGVGAIEPRRPIPSIHNRQAIRNLAVAAAELDCH